MDNNYWQEYWDNYYKFMAVYLGGLQANYDNVDMKKAKNQKLQKE